MVFRLLTQRLTIFIAVTPACLLSSLAQMGCAARWLWQLWPLEYKSEVRPVLVRPHMRAGCSQSLKMDYVKCFAEFLGNNGSNSNGNY